VKDDKTVDSVVRNLEIIAEDANRLRENFRTQHAEIEWRKIVGMGIGSFTIISIST
jgi:uncharacterized protein with HEPN domain